MRSNDIYSNHAPFEERLVRAQQQRVTARRKAIESRLQKGEFGDRELSVGLKAFDGLCDVWAISPRQAQKILFATDASGTKQECALLLERISYLLRIFRLMNDVVQGDAARQQRWLRRANVALGGKRPIDCILAGPNGG